MRHPLHTSPQTPVVTLVSPPRRFLWHVHPPARYISNRGRDRCPCLHPPCGRVCSLTIPNNDKGSPRRCFSGATMISLGQYDLYGLYGKREYGKYDKYGKIWYLKYDKYDNIVRENPEFTL